MAATMSTMCITCPPSSLPSALVCAGRTTSAISDADALTGLPFTLHSSINAAVALCFALISLPCAAALAGNRHYTYNTQDHYDGTKQNQAAEAGAVSSSESGRRVFALWDRAGVPARRRHPRRRSAFQGIARSQPRLCAGIPDVRPDAGGT